MTIPIRIGVTDPFAFHVPSPSVPESIEPDTAGPTEELSMIALYVETVARAPRRNQPTADGNA
jgi:hypothetical protein